MSFHNRLLTDTAAARLGLLSAPIIQGVMLRGEVSLPSYIAFLTEAYHHVKHTVPLLRAAKAALPAHHAWLNDAMDEYIEEEVGHDEWILDDIRACGGDAEAVRHGQPSHATEVMVAYAYDTIARRNPWGSSAWCTCWKAPAWPWRCRRPTPSRNRWACPTAPSATSARTAPWTRSTRPTSRC